ncbi:Protein of unknown function (DUF3037) [Nitrosomonas oligotropha]|uniref:DUF3037 domain-containing protein n=1 Tax=Nitrosomonas oligotropha TaxID=42354 RepID=A0A2T5HSY9_9PROT|nr:DUF3037 domain-containing protein [Nitrosomonas oligotropha]PTQ74700.1 Protein of unknown function (DUF3037) [Nitrosomonas oligotropha]
MNKIACQYTIVRFSPFIETGEFANVGIVMMASKQRYFASKLETQRYARITRFFEELDRKLYTQAIHVLKVELERLHQVLKAHGFDRRFKANDVDFAQQLFAELIRPRENIVRFSEPRIVLAENPKEKLDELFSYYVERNFVTKEYIETRLEKGIRKWLYQASIGDRFQRLAVGDDEYEAIFPFVEQVDDRPVKIIKPLNLAQEKPSKIIDHGNLWRSRIEELKRRKRLPGRVLFTVRGPEDIDTHRGHAYKESLDRLQNAGVEIEPYENKEKIIEFARA